VRIALAVLVVACLLPRHANAGRSFYGWLYGTEVMPERGVELQTWIFEQNGKYGARDKESALWWGPLVGVTDQLELALPLELEWTSTDEGQTSFTFRRFGVEARYRLVSPDPNEAGGLVPLLRVAAKRDVSARSDVRLEADAVMSYEAGPVHVLIDVGFVSDLAPHHRHSEVRPGGGFSIHIASGLRLGAEAYSELSVDSLGPSWAAAGPNLAWTHGRFWFSGAYGIGIYHVRTAPRFMWGIAF
jgi:hypothetical protein